jgi:RNA polymerase sigma-70 factor (ECF subfamily)
MGARLPPTPIVLSVPDPPLACPVVASPSFEEVFRDCAPFVWRVVRGLGVREADIEDVCQEVFLVVHRKLEGFGGRSSVRTWVYGICVRVASDYRHRAHHRREHTVERMPEPVLEASQDEDLERSRALAWLDDVLDALEDAKRAVFVLYEIEHVPMDEVAEAVGCPVATAYARLYAARKYIEAAARREQAKRGSL